MQTDCNHVPYSGEGAVEISIDESTSKCHFYRRNLTLSLASFSYFTMGRETLDDMAESLVRIRCEGLCLGGISSVQFLSLRWNQSHLHLGKGIICRFELFRFLIFPDSSCSVRRPRSQSQESLWLSSIRTWSSVRQKIVSWSAQHCHNNYHTLVDIRISTKNIYEVIPAIGPIFHIKFELYLDGWGSGSDSSVLQFYENYQVTFNSKFLFLHFDPR